MASWEKQLWVSCLMAADQAHFIPTHQCHVCFSPVCSQINPRPLCEHYWWFQLQRFPKTKVRNWWGKHRSGQRNRSYSRNLTQQDNKVPRLSENMDWQTMSWILRGLRSSKYWGNIDGYINRRNCRNWDNPSLSFHELSRIASMRSPLCVIPFGDSSRRIARVRREAPIWPRHWSDPHMQSKPLPVAS